MDTNECIKTEWIVQFNGRKCFLNDLYSYLSEVNWSAVEKGDILYYMTSSSAATYNLKVLMVTEVNGKRKVILSAFDGRNDR